MSSRSPAWPLRFQRGLKHPCNRLKRRPKQIKLADNVAPGFGGTFSFSFAYGAKLKDPAAEGQPFNGMGLPYQIVATQHGITPNDVNNTPNNLGH